MAHYLPVLPAGALAMTVASSSASAADIVESLIHVIDSVLLPQ
jgi:hypothetical protein